VPVLRTGMGPVRAAAAATRIAQAPPRALALAGVCGAVRAGTKSGEVIVATEIRSAGGSVQPTGAEVVAAALRAAGCTVHCGALWTARHVAGDAHRRRLATEGVLGVDMESFPLARLGIPVTVVRSIVDTPEVGLVHPATLRNGPRALRTLRGVGPALRTWSTWLSSEPGAAKPARTRTTE
jgi:4-hydroxy-3-methylbut-2-enyl diphosphate reductase